MCWNRSPNQLNLISRLVSFFLLRTVYGPVKSKLSKWSRPAWPVWPSRHRAKGRQSQTLWRSNLPPRQTSATSTSWPWMTRTASRAENTGRRHETLHVALMSRAGVPRQCSVLDLFVTSAEKNCFLPWLYLRMQQKFKKKYIYIIFFVFFLTRSLWPVLARFFVVNYFSQCSWVT